MLKNRQVISFRLLKPLHNDGSSRVVRLGGDAPNFFIRADCGGSLARELCMCLDVVAGVRRRVVGRRVL